MRYLVHVERSADEASWDVRITAGTWTADRTMDMVVSQNDPAQVFPRPGGSQREADTLAETYRQLITKDSDQDTVRAFGSYLFDALLGAEVWQRIVADAHGEPVELALAWAESERALTRLPWEMLRHGETYLAALQEPQVAISRLVLGARSTQENLEVKPRVLFVVGASLTDGQIRAGAEYIELLRHLADQAPDDDGESGSLATEIVLDATAERLREAMIRYDPSIVHFICHGTVRPTERGPQGVLQMMSDEEEGRVEEKTAEQLISMLTAGQPQPPPVVVLNACHTGAGPRAAAPLAAELVSRGVPVVVGMWGEVADQACRLFTWCFYEALLKDKPVVAAVAVGRRRAFESGLDPNGADWAFPAIYLAENVAAVALDQAAARKVSDLESIALQYRQENRPPFCDRLEIVQRSYRQLMNAGERGPRVLAIKVAQAERESLRYGKTRALAEICVKLVADGYLPCFVQAGLSEPPSAQLKLAMDIVAAIAEVRRRFGRPRADSYEVLKLKNMLAGKQVQLAPRVDEQLLVHPLRAGALQAGDELDHRVLAAAVHQDLLDLSAEVHEPAKPPRVVLLLDDVHAFGSGALDLLLKGLLVPQCLSGPRQHVPVILAYSSTDRQQSEYDTAARKLRSFLEGNRLVIRPQPELAALPDPDTDRFPWIQFLIGQTPPFVVNPHHPDPRITPKEVFEFLYETTESGTPSLLLNRAIDPFLGVCIRWGALLQAQDADVLQQGRPR